MKERTSRLPIFLLLPFYGEEGKEKQDGNVDFGFVKYKKKKSEEFGAYHTLVQELRLGDREFYLRLEF